MITEKVTLPTMGIIYPQLKGESQVTVRPFVTKDYKDLLASNGGEDAINNLIDACLVDCPLTSKQLHVIDKGVILYKIRAITLGNLTEVGHTCPFCHKENIVVWDINTLPVDYLSIQEYPIKVTLPESKTVIGLRYPTEVTESMAKQQAQKRADIFKMPVENFLTTYRAVSVIDHPDGLDMVSKAEWFEQLSVRDVIFIDHVASKMNDFGMRVIKSQKCIGCGRDFNITLLMREDFFRPKFEDFEWITTKKGSLEVGITDATPIE